MTVSAARRIAHLGLGAFHRSHQAWYTQLANESAEPGDGWEIVAFTGRRPDAAELLSAQGCRYTLLTRGPERDDATDIRSIVEAFDGARPEWESTIADPAVALITMTVTEAGYETGYEAGYDTDEKTGDGSGPTRADASGTPAARLAAGLRARQRADAGPIAIVSCDNVPANGSKTKEIVLAESDSTLSEWIQSNVSFIFGMVDRITPATTDADVRAARDLVGWDDRAPVVAEPFTEWVMQGEFPAGRPAWEVAGARLVADVTPYENRKLWMLNGAHSLMAYRGIERGRVTVFDAWADPVLRDEVEQLWSEARVVLDLPTDELDAWLSQLRIRWQNPRIEHRLSQIALGGEQKVPARFDPVARLRREAGFPRGEAGAVAVAAWERYRAR